MVPRWRSQIAWNLLAFALTMLVVAAVVALLLQGSSGGPSGAFPWS